MGIKIGNLDINAFKVGSDDCKVYLGDILLYSTTSSFFCKLTLNDDSVVELEGSGELTSAMTSSYISSLVSAEIGTLCTTIGNGSFYECSGLTSIVIPNSVTTMGGYAFYYCSSLTSIVIPSGVTSIGDGAFRNCSSLTSLDIPDSVASIGGSLISDSGIQTITIGSGITYIGACGLCCNNLTNGVTIKAVNPPTIPNCDWIFSVPSLIYVPAESVTAYQNDQCWSVYAAGIQAIPNS